jgi:hypothetical protein
VIGEGQQWSVGTTLAVPPSRPSSEREGLQTKNRNGHQSTSRAHKKSSYHLAASRSIKARREPAAASSCTGQRPTACVWGAAGKDQDDRWVQERMQQVAEEQRQLKADLAEHALLLGAASSRLQDLQQGADQGRAAALEARGQGERLAFLQTMVRPSGGAGHRCAPAAGFFSRSSSIRWGIAALMYPPCMMA